MTKERRAEIREVLRSRNVLEAGGFLTRFPDLTKDELRALLDSDERLEALESRERYVEQVVDECLAGIEDDDDNVVKTLSTDPEKE